MIDRLAGWLAPVEMPQGERLGFGLAGFRSVFTRELLLLRMRRQSVYLGTGLPPLPAMIEGDALAVDVAALLAMNAVLREQVGAAPADMVDAIRTADAADRVAARRLRERRDCASLVAAIEANGRMQAMGALRFAVVPELRARLGADAEALLRPAGLSLWQRLRVREVALARGMGRPGFERALRGYLAHHAWLHGEDVEIVETASRAAVVARLVAMAGNVEEERAALRTRQDAEPPMVGSRIALGRAVAWHDDANRRGKMRLLATLIALAVQQGLPPATTGLVALGRGLPATP